MVSALSKDEGSARCRAGSSDSFLSRALGKGLRTMAREHSGLVDQPPGLVGTSDTGLVSKSEVREIRNLCRHRAATEFGELDPRSRYARYLVFVLALGLRNYGRRDAKEILSDLRPGNRAGHYLLLGCAHDHRRAGVHAGKIRTRRGQHPVSRRFLYRTYSRQAGPQDVEEVGQLARSARVDEQIRPGWIAVRFDAH